MSDDIIDMIWKDTNTDDIIFIDQMQVKDFKYNHGVSPHTYSEGGYHDVIVKIEVKHD